MSCDDQKKYLNEHLYLFQLYLRIGLRNFDEYGQWLDQMYLRYEELSLLELECASNDLNETIHLLTEDAMLTNLDADVLATLMMKDIKREYFKNPDGFLDVARLYYQIWKLLPYELNSREPFSTLCYLDDIVEWNTKEEVIQIIKDMENSIGKEG